MRILLPLLAVGLVVGASIQQADQWPWSSEPTTTLAPTPAPTPSQTDARDQLDPDQQVLLSSLVSLELGPNNALAADTDALTAAVYIALEVTAARNSGEDLTPLAAVSRASGLREATRYVLTNAGQDMRERVRVLTSANGVVTLCQGPTSELPTHLTLTNGFVTDVQVGIHSCT